MDSTPLIAESKEGQEQPPKGMQSLYEVCHQVVDGREARGKQYDLAGLLVVLVLAKLAGMKSVLGASDWAKDQQALLRQRLQLSWKHMPCANTYSYALARLDSQQVNTTLAAWFVRKAGRKPVRGGTEPINGTAKPAARSPSRGWQSLERHRQAAVWGRGATEAGLACV